MMIPSVMIQRVAPVVVVLLILWAVPATGQAPVPQVQLRASIEQLIGILEDDTLKAPENAAKRRGAIRDCIHQRFDFERMSQLSLARYWRDRTPEEQTSFVYLFSRLLEETYVSRIEGYSNEEVIYISEVIQDKKAVISTKVVMGTLEIPIDYRMYLTGSGKWMVYDLVVEGVSLVGNYRSQFNQMLSSGTYEAMVEKLRQRISPQNS